MRRFQRLLALTREIDVFDIALQRAFVERIVVEYLERRRRCFAVLAQTFTIPGLSQTDLLPVVGERFTLDLQPRVEARPKRDVDAAEKGATVEGSGFAPVFVLLGAPEPFDIGVYLPAEPLRLHLETARPGKLAGVADKFSQVLLRRLPVDIRTEKEGQIVPSHPFA